MRHRKHRRRLQRSHNERAALINGLIKNLLTHQSIRTTHVKAKAAQSMADRVITLGKDDSVHSRRQALRILGDRTLVRRLFTEIAPLFKNRQGGYTRVLHLDYRKGDGAPMAILELVDKKQVPLKPAKAKKAAAGKIAPSQAHTHAEADSAAEVTETKKSRREAPTQAEQMGEKGKSGEKKENFVQNLKKFFKRKGQE
jgi:large subunit ribosomal protein L17